MGTAEPDHGDYERSGHLRDLHNAEEEARGGVDEAEQGIPLVDRNSCGSSRTGILADAEFNEQHNGLDGSVDASHGSYHINSGCGGWAWLRQEMEVRYEVVIHF